MSQSSNEPDSNGTQIVDPSGNPFPQRLTWRQRWKAISSKTKSIVVSLAAIVVGTAGFLANIATIQNYLRSEPALPTVPLVIVKLFNSDTKDISVAARGDFFLRMPGPGARHTIGKYEFRTADGNFPETGQITVEPNTTVTLYAQVLNQRLYGRILEQADSDISFMVRRVNGGIKFTEDLPFTKDAIDKYHVSADVGAD